MNLLDTALRWFRWGMQFRWLVTHHLIAEQQAARQRILEQERYADPRRLNRYEYQVFSQNGEDGIIAEIFKRIGVVHRSFVEIGVENGLETNTTFLLLQGWEGCWVENNRRHVAFIQRHFAEALTEKRLKIIQSLVTAENVISLLLTAEVPTEFDLLSLDIDRNTYYVLRSILESFRPRVIVVEYNALIPPHVEWRVEYNPRKMWNRSSYFGASLLAFERLCRDKGYLLVGCDLCGVNAFFVRSDLCDARRFAAPFTAENHYEPLRDYLLCRVGPPRSFTDLT